MFTFGFAFLFLTLGTTQVCADVNADNSASVQAVQQQSVAKGRVVDANGEPLVGVSVFEEGTSNGTITDADGNFTLSVPRNASITVSYVGFETQSLRATGNMSVVLQEENNELNEVIVVGYGTQKKVAVSGSIVNVNVAELAASRPVTNVGTALAGQVAGMKVINTGNVPGAEAQNITIRGTGTFSSAGSAPLIIIDGVEGYMSDVDASDIESVTVLKDAASAAIYGSRAANGVILVTTKKGKAGQVRIGYNGYVSFQSANTKPMQPVSSFADHMRYMNEAYTNNNQEPVYDQRFIDEWNNNPNDPLGHPNTDWVKEIFGTGVGHNHSVYMQGGTEKVDFYGSVGYNKNEGVVENAGYEKYHALANITAHVNKYLDMGMNFKGSYGQAEMGGMRGEDGSFDTGWSYATTPAQIFRYNGMFGGSQDPTSIGGANNPIQSQYSTRGNNTSRNGNAKFFVKVMPFKGFEVETSLVYDYFDRNYKAIPVFHEQWNFANMTVVSPATGQTSITQNNFRNQRNYTDVVAHYNHRFIEDKLGVAAMAGASQEMYTTENEKISRKDLTDPSLSVLSAASGDISLSGAKSTWSMRSYFGRLSLDWENKYYLEGSFRGDGSSRFLKGNRWGWFPSFSAAWRLSEEEFMKDNGIFDNLKLRVGYGSLGNNAVSNYAAYSLYSQVGAVMNGQWVTGLYSSSAVNPYLTWEKTKTFNVALDFSLLNQRLSGYIEYYNKKTDGILTWVTLPGAGGDWNGVTKNAAEVSNKGIEFAVNTRNIDTPDFKWNSSLTFAYNKEEVTKLMGTGADFVTSTDGQYMHIVGEPVYSFRHFKLDGVWSESEKLDAAVFGQKPGDLKISVPGMKRVGPGEYTKVVGGETVTYYVEEQEKLDDKGNLVKEYVGNKYALSSSDYQPIGHNSPDWSLGFQNSFIYKNFDLTLYMYMRWGQMIKYETITDYDPTGVGNFPTYLLDKVGTTLPLLDATKTNKLSQYEGFDALKYVDGSFFKIKNITLGYTLPKDLLKKINIQKFRIYGTMTNPLVLAKSDMIQDYDPEMNGSRNYPLTKQLVFGLNVTF